MHSLSDIWNFIIGIAVLKAWAVVKVILFYIIVRFITYRLIKRVLKSLIGREPTPVAAGRIRTLGSLILSIVHYVLIFISGVMLLRVFDFDPAPVLAAAGVVGLAVGFGAQKLVRDIISGFFIVLENQYSVGECVTIVGVTGTVEELGMRITQLRDEAGKLVTIPNGDIAQVVNHSRT